MQPVASLTSSTPCFLSADLSRVRSDLPFFSFFAASLSSSASSTFSRMSSSLGYSGLIPLIFFTSAAASFLRPWSAAQFATLTRSLQYWSWIFRVRFLSAASICSSRLRRVLEERLVWASTVVGTRRNATRRRETYGEALRHLGVLSFTGLPELSSVLFLRSVFFDPRELSQEARDVLIESF